MFSDVHSLIAKNAPPEVEVFLSKFCLNLKDPKEQVDMWSVVNLLIEDNHCVIYQ